MLKAIKKLVLVFLSAVPLWSGYAQPTLDASFLPARIYQPSTVTAVRQLGSGARVVAGAMLRADGQAANGLVRYLPNGAVDAVFAANVASNQWQPGFVAEAANGQLFVANVSNATTAPMLVSGQVCRGLVRLQADGTLDPSFSLGAGLNGYLYSLVVQPDGKVVLGGSFTSAAGQAVGNLVRLTVNGTPDANFLAAGRGCDAEVRALALQPDGKLLVGGRFRNVHGQAAPLLARLLPSGALDPGFTIPASSSSFAEVQAVAIQPDGSILANSAMAAPLSSSADLLVRVASTGAYDPGFRAANPTLSGALWVQPDGKVLVSRFSGGGRNGPSTGGLVRLLSSGSTDPSFQVPATNAGVASVQVLPNGQFLLGGGPAAYAASPVALGVALFNLNGSRDLSFAPHLQDAGEVKDMALQADGRLIIGGMFDEVNGQVAHGLARLLADGTPDTAYAPATAVGTVVNALALQPDGKLLVGGDFTTLGGNTRSRLARLLPTGTADPGFALPVGLALPVVHVLALQPDGQVLLAGANGFGFSRVTANGQPDPGFQPPTTLQAYALQVQPDGRIVVGGYYFVGSTSYPLVRLAADGTLDNSFIRQSAFGVLPRVLSLYPDGRILVGGSFSRYSTSTSSGVMRLRANGLPDNTFVASLGTTEVLSLAIQPNQRILVGGLIDTGSPTIIVGTTRLLDSGSLDASYAAGQGPERIVNKVLVQPDGKLLVAGSFLNASGQPILGLARLQAPHVLAITTAKALAQLEAWPVPAHNSLNLQLEAAASPRIITLLNMLGQAVLRQPTNQVTLTLSLKGVPAGNYILRVECAESVVTRPIAIE